MVVRETQHQTSVLTNSIVDSFLFGMSLEQVNWNYLQRLLMGRLQINRTGNPGIGCIQPSLRAYAPSFAGFQAGKAVPRSGVIRSLPCCLANSRKSSVKIQHTTCRPRSRSSVLQQPSRYHPVKGSEEQVSSSPPRTLMLGCMGVATGCLRKTPSQRWLDGKIAVHSPLTRRKPTASADTTAKSNHEIARYQIRADLASRVEFRN